MTENDGQIGIADLLLANFLYTKLNFDDDSGYHQIELSSFKVRWTKVLEFLLRRVLRIFLQFKLSKTHVSSTHLKLAFNLTS